MKEIVIISGKGGTGKTSITAALAKLFESNIIVADCDVDASDLHLILNPRQINSEDFFSGVKAEIIQSLCIRCDSCRKVCRFSAVSFDNNRFFVNNLGCEGCGYCSYICPREAIVLVEQKIGECIISEVGENSYLIHSKLKIGADNSGKLVAKIKREAKILATKKQREYVIIDGSPGIGCPVISSLSGADLVVFVTEPTLSAFSDLKRVWELTKKFNIPASCIINKADLNYQTGQSIKEYLREEKIRYITSIPYDSDFQRAITDGISLIEYNISKWRETFQTIWEIIN